jgi:hypothetical protein
MLACCSPLPILDFLRWPPFFGSWRLENASSVCPVWRRIYSRNVALNCLKLGRIRLRHAQHANSDDPCPNSDPVAAFLPFNPSHTNYVVPEHSTLPAPIAQDPANSAWGTGSNDFPLTVSNPTAAASMTSPINVVASATPKNPIFFHARVCR